MIELKFPVTSAVSTSSERSIVARVIHYSTPIYLLNFLNYLIARTSEMNISLRGREVEAERASGEREFSARDGKRKTRYLARR